jgi:hypothetical protein
MTDARILQIILIIGVTLLFTSVSYSIFITYLILKKFSDLGNSSCKLNEYAPRGLDYKRMVDNVPTNEKYFLLADYGVDPYMDKKHSIPEVLLKNAQKDQEDEF